MPFIAENPLRKSIQIINQRGLHARASAKFVQLVNGFDASVEVTKDGLSVDGSSILDLMLLAASPGCSIEVSSWGPQAQDVMDALDELIGDRFGEEC